MKILGIFRGFPGLGRVVSGVALLETLRDKYDCEIKCISYLQGNRYLESHGFEDIREAIPMDYCSIGLLPTNKMGQYIHQTIRTFNPDVVLIDGEPLLTHSLRISHPNIKIAVLLNPADVRNDENDKESMDYFNTLYACADLAIVHGLLKITDNGTYRNFVSTNTILRPEIMSVYHKTSKNIYCVLGGGTVNVGHQFAASTIALAELCQQAAVLMPDYIMHIICSSSNIYDAINENYTPNNVVLHSHVLNASDYYNDACLIITRSGRNTLSELAFLGIPAISVITGDDYRRKEQTRNLKAINSDNIKAIPTNIDLVEFVALCKKLVDTSCTQRTFIPGNDTAIRKILSM